jgi:outer membrane protein assembly factor BamB
MSLRLYESKSLATIRKSVMEKLFLGISNHVVCLNKKTGIQVWKTKLKSSSITNVYYEDGNIFAYSGGHLFCLDAVDGSINWENPLKGFGYSTCIIASEHQNNAVISSQIATQQSVAAATIVASTAASSSN